MSETTELPDDIREQAKLVLDGCEDWPDAVDAVATALWTERQRCAQAARSFLSMEYQSDYGSLPESVAEAILTQETPKWPPAASSPSRTEAR